MNNFLLCTKTYLIFLIKLKNTISEYFSFVKNTINSNKYNLMKLLINLDILIFFIHFTQILNHFFN